MMRLAHGCCIGDDIFYQTAAKNECHKKMENPVVESTVKRKVFLCFIVNIIRIFFLIQCLLSCIYNKYGLLNGDKVNFDAVRKFITNMDEKVISPQAMKLKSMIAPVLVKEVDFCEKNGLFKFI